MRVKKTNEQLKKKKIDLFENGEFRFKEPNKPVKRLGKDSIRQALEML